MTHETFSELVRDPAHWEFELFLMLLFDGLIFGLIWRAIKKHWQHHLARDAQEQREICEDCAGEIVEFEKEIVVCKGCGTSSGIQPSADGPRTDLDTASFREDWQSQGDGYHGE